MVFRSTGVRRTRNTRSPVRLRRHNRSVIGSDARPFEAVLETGGAQLRFGSPPTGVR